MILFGLTLLITGVLSETVTNINLLTDHSLVRLNDAIREYNMASVSVSDFSYNGFQLAEGQLVGEDSFYRTADSTLTYLNDGTAYYDLHLGLRLMALAFGRIGVNGDWMSGVFRIHNNSFHISFSMRNGSYCGVSVDRYAMEVLDNVTLDSSLEQYDRTDFTDIFKLILPSINENLYKEKHRLEQNLNHIMCQSHIPYDWPILSFRNNLKLSFGK